MEDPDSFTRKQIAFTLIGAMSLVWLIASFINIKTTNLQMVDETVNRITDSSSVLIEEVDIPHRQFVRMVSSKLTDCGRKTGRLIALLEDEAVSKAAAESIVLGAMENCYKRMENHGNIKYNSELVRGLRWALRSGFTKTQKQPYSIFDPSMHYQLSILAEPHRGRPISPPSECAQDIISKVISDGGTYLPVKKVSAEIKSAASVDFEFSEREVATLPLRCPGLNI